MGKRLVRGFGKDRRQASFPSCLPSYHRAGSHSSTMPDSRHRLPSLRLALGDYLPPASPVAPLAFPTFPRVPAAVHTFNYLLQPPTPLPIAPITRRPSLCAKHARRSSYAPYPSPVSPHLTLPPLPSFPLDPGAALRRPSLPSLTRPQAAPATRPATAPNFSPSSGLGHKLSCQSCRKSKKKVRGDAAVWQVRAERVGVQDAGRGAQSRSTAKVERLEGHQSARGLQAGRYCSSLPHYTGTDLLSQLRSSPPTSPPSSALGSPPHQAFDVLLECASQEYDVRKREGSLQSALSYLIE